MLVRQSLHSENENSVQYEIPEDVLGLWRYSFLHHGLVCSHSHVRKHQEQERTRSKAALNKDGAVTFVHR